MKRNNLKFNFLSLTTGVALLILVAITNQLTKNQYFTQEIYPKIYHKIHSNYSGFFNFLSFSLGDVLYLFLIVFLIYKISKGLKKIIQKEFLKALKIFSQILFFLMSFWVIFHWVWGFNYYKKPIIRSAKTEIPLDDLKSMALQHFERAKRYSEQNLDFMPDSSVKVSLFSPLMRYFGVTGYFNPFSGEAQRVGKIPLLQIPFTNAHELAHQKGWAREYEANYIGYTNASKGDIPSRYSAEYAAMNYILREIYAEDSIFVRNIINEFPPKMQVDRAERIRFHEKYKGIADEVFTELNHYFLKSNNQTEGVKSYSRFVELLHQDYLKSKDLAHF